MSVTHHARKRVKQRLGLKKCLADSIADDALKEGTKRENTNGNLRRFLDKIYYRNPDHKEIIVHHQKVFIFKDDLLITVYALPGNLSIKKIRRRSDEDDETS